MFCSFDRLGKQTHFFFIGVGEDTVFERLYYHATTMLKSLI